VCGIWQGLVKGAELVEGECLLRCLLGLLALCAWIMSDHWSLVSELLLTYSSPPRPIEHRLTRLTALLSAATIRKDNIPSSTRNDPRSACKQIPKKIQYSKTLPITENSPELTKRWMALDLFPSCVFVQIMDGVRSGRRDEEELRCENGWYLNAARYDCWMGEEYQNFEH
jgi:hypothetical protein